MKFFVSYATKDEKWAKWVVWELENARPRHRCVAQFRDFAPGMNFMERMRKAAEAESTVALFSPHYFRSNYCSQELDAALTGKSNRLLPVRLAECDPGAFLANRIHIDLAGKTIDEARDALLSGVEAYVAQTLKAGASRGFRQRPHFPGPAQPEQNPVIRTANEETEGPLKVLFIAPEVGGLSPRKQLREMQRGVSQTRHTGAVRFKGVFDIRVNGLFKELNRESPDVFHFSGKQSGGDILMRTDKGTLTTVSDMALAGMFQSLDQGLKLVIIDTCFSLRCATRVAKVVPCAIGVDGGIYEDEAVTFYTVFYQAVASGCSVKHAISQAQTALKFAKAATSHIPELRCRPGVDPGRVFLVKAARTHRQAAGN